METQNSSPQIDKPVQKDETSRLLDILFDDFEKHIDKEKEFLVILLKGHLLLEYYLNQIILLYRENISVEKMGFFEKISTLQAIDQNLFRKEIFNSLKKINELRNRLSHNLDSKITMSEIDTIGFCFGKKYILVKYDNPKNEEFLLKWVLKRTAGEVFYPIYAEVARSKGLTPLSNA